MGVQTDMAWQVDRHTWGLLLSAQLRSPDFERRLPRVQGLSRHWAP